MRLQLDESQVEAIASTCGASASVEGDVSRVLQAFAVHRHSPFTRKDITAVLQRMGSSAVDSEKGTVQDSKAWHTIGARISQIAQKGPGRGFYSLDLPPVRETAEARPHSSVREGSRTPTARDNRDGMTWVVFELSSAGESFASDGYLEEHLRQALQVPGHEVFVPYLSYAYDGRTALFNVMEGYAFAAAGLDERIYFNAVHNSPYLRGVLHFSGGNTPVLQTVPDSSVQELRDRLAEMVAVEIEEGMRVEITRGICQGLQGVVVGLSGEGAYVLVSLRTLRTIRTIPRFALLPVGDTS